MSYFHFKVQPEAPGIPYEFEVHENVIPTLQNPTPGDDFYDRTTRIAQERLAGSAEVRHPQAQGMVLVAASAKDDDQMDLEGYPAPSFLRIDGSFSSPDYTEEDTVDGENDLSFFHRAPSAYVTFNEENPLLAQSPPPPIGLWQLGITFSAPPIARTTAFSNPTQDPRQVRAITHASNYSNPIPKVAAQAIMENFSKKERANFMRIVTYGRPCIPPMKLPSPLQISEIVSVEN